MIMPLCISTPMGYSVDSHTKTNPVPRACSVRELHHSTGKELGQSPLYKTTYYRDKREGEGKPIRSQNPKAWEGFLGSPVRGEGLLKMAEPLPGQVFHLHRTFSPCNVLLVPFPSASQGSFPCSSKEIKCGLEMQAPALKTRDTKIAMF